MVKPSSQPAVSQPAVKPLATPTQLITPSTPVKKNPAPVERGSAPIEEEFDAPPVSVSFTLPGIIGIQEGQWRGTDHLLNLTNNIFVSADIMASKDVKLPFSEQVLIDRVTAKFIQAGLHPEGATHGGQPPLPYLHFVIMVQPCGDEFAAFIQARLFEKVKLDRVVLPPEVVFQAITWEDENFIIMSYSQLQDEVFKQMDEMTEYFVSRFNFFEKETFRLQGK